MKYYCCLCEAILSELRDGFIPDGGGAPLCDEHLASCREQSRKPTPPKVVTLPLSDEERYVRSCIAAALKGTPSFSLADLFKPSDATLQ
jgi:hypothetical protein